MDELAEGLKALADPTRPDPAASAPSAPAWRTVRGRLDGLPGLPQPKVSRHLRYLKKERWVLGRRDGKWMHCELSIPRHPILVKVMQALFEIVGVRSFAMASALRVSL